MNIPSAYFTILILKCLKNTLKLQFDSYVTGVKFLSKPISASAQVPDKPALAWVACPGILHRS